MTDAPPPFRPPPGTGQPILSPEASHPTATGSGGSGTMDVGSFLGGLFDFRFNNLISRKAVGIIYLVATILIGLTTLALLVGGLASGGLQAIVTLVLVPLLGLVYLTWTRVIVEMVVVRFRQVELLEQLVEQGRINATK